jgi:hypothetical protein
MYSREHFRNDSIEEGSVILRKKWKFFFACNKADPLVTLAYIQGEANAQCSAEVCPMVF